MATNLSALEAAMVEATASRAPVERKLTTTKAEYDAARAELTARAQAGETVQGRNSKGQFLHGVKVSTFGVTPVAPVVARKVEKAVEAPRPTARGAGHDRHAPASAFAISAEV